VRGSRTLSVNHGFLESFRLPSDCDAALLLAPPAEKLPPRGSYRGSRYYRRTHPSLGLPTRLRHPPHRYRPAAALSSLTDTHTRMSVGRHSSSPRLPLPAPRTPPLASLPLRRRLGDAPRATLFPSLSGVKVGTTQVGPAKACTHRPARHTIVYYACRSD
jgi:hypothetical protein